MARIIVALENDVERVFRQTAMKKFGMKRGYLKAALNEAVENWIKLNLKGDI